MRRNSATIIKYSFLFFLLFCFLWTFGGIGRKSQLRSLDGVRQSRFDSQNLWKRKDLHKPTEKKVKPEVKQLNNNNNNGKNYPDENEREKQEHDKELVDWHDYLKIAKDKERKGPGEHGVGVNLGPEEEKQKRELFMSNGFNGLVSDKISLHRSIVDIRHPNCWKKRYYRKLPKASVVVPFHNEHWSTLLRTVYGVLERAPPELIEEVILVDDFSSKEHCKQRLTDYVRDNFDKVKIIRAQKREGLIRTRLLGAKVAKAPVIIFLDSHVEPSTNWLPPLLQPIADDRKTVTCPFIDVIDYNTFAVRAQDEGARGAFDWRMDYKRLPKLPETRLDPSEIFESPVMAGGLFAISSSWFWELGGYDPGLEIWGGEQYELSFKIWQCGGRMVDIPCSRIGHIYRRFAPFSAGSAGDYLGRNHRRVAEVWMDEYKKYVYERQPHFGKANPGNITAQINLRKRLKCKPFKWFMENVAFDLEKSYPAVVPKSSAVGEIRNIDSNLCIDTRFQGINSRFNLETCMKDAGNPGEQKFEITWRKDLKPWHRTVCFDASSNSPRAPVILYPCHGQRGNQHWKYNPKTLVIFHQSTQNCLDCDPNTKEIFINACNTKIPTQKWKFENFNETALLIEWNEL